MYLQIKLYPGDRSSHRILWRIFNVDQEPTVYEFDRLVFGLNCSPFLAQLVTQHYARLCKQRYPMASETTLKSTYMDDSMDLVQNDTQGIQLYTSNCLNYGRKLGCVPINGYPILKLF